jgi:hypothetical protein
MKIPRKTFSEKPTRKGKQLFVRPHDFGASRQGIEMDRLNQFVDELVVEDYLRKAGR